MTERTGKSWLSGSLIGRSRELAAPGERAARAGLVILSGPAGIGRTSLLHALVNGGACRDMTVFHGRCGEVVTNAGCGGVRALFGRLGLTETDGAEGACGAASAVRCPPCDLAPARRNRARPRPLIDFLLRYEYAQPTISFPLLPGNGP